MYSFFLLKNDCHNREHDHDLQIYIFAAFTIITIIINYENGKLGSRKDREYSNWEVLQKHLQI
jgi:hypothetical protein